MIDRLNKRIAELEEKNRILAAKNEEYKRVIVDARTAKSVYIQSIKSCKEIAQAYLDAMNEAKYTKYAYEVMMKDQIEDFRLQSKKLLDDLLTDQPKEEENV